MSASDTFASPIAEEVEGIGKVAFYRFTATEYGEIEQAVHASLIEYHSKLLRLCGVSGQEMYFALAKSVPEQIGINEVFNWCSSVSGMKEVLSKSLQKSGTDEKQIGAIVAHWFTSRHVLDRNNLIQAVLGVGKRRQLAEILADIEKRKNEASDPNPTNGSAQSTGPKSSDVPSEQDAQTPAN